MSILQEGKNCWKITQSDSIDFLVDGEHYYRKLFSALVSAKRNIYILGWDIDSELCLIRDQKENNKPFRLKNILESLVADNKNLSVHILIWDFHAFYTVERELFPQVKLGWQLPDAIRFRFDNETPVGSSHHQKMVVIDDEIAFCGGIDLTKNRWDSSEHLAKDPRRKNSQGETYGPFHDVQLKVEGQTAEVLGDLFRNRWYRATCERISKPETNRSVPCQKTFSIAISRTIPKYKDCEEKREIEQLIIDLIHSSKKCLYIENQFLSSKVIGESLVDCLQKKEGPEVIIILPYQSSSWMEESVMGCLKDYWIAKLHKADQYDRLGIYYVVTDDSEDDSIMIHSKVMIVDHLYARVGSSNFSNRSMGLDTECDLILDATTDPKAQKLVTDFRYRLLSEFTGMTPKELEVKVNEQNSLIKAIHPPKNNFKHRLRLFTPKNLKELEKKIKHINFLDPEKPLVAERFIDQVVFVQNKKRLTKRVKSPWRTFWSIFVILIMIAIPTVWYFCAQRFGWDLQSLKSILESIQQYPLTPVLVYLIFAIAGSLFLPINLLILAVASVYPSVLAIFYILSGSLLCGFLGYGFGWILGQKKIQKMFPERLQSVHQKLSQAGVVSVALLRILPIAPYAVINLLSGASQIKISSYLLGTLLGLIPGTLLLVFFQKSLLSLVFEPSVSSVLIFLVLLVFLMIAGVYLKRRISKSISDDSKD